MRNQRKRAPRHLTALLALALALALLPGRGASALSPAPKTPDGPPAFVPGYVPVETQFSYPGSDGTAALLDASLPASYDARDYGLITPVRNQGSNGICWTFSMLGVLEASLLKNGYPAEDLSEAHMAHSTSSYNGNAAEGWDREPGGGGNANYAAGYLMRGTGLNGAVRERDDPYTELFSPLQGRDPAITRDKPKSYTVRNILFMTGGTKPAPKVVDAVKEGIMTCGAAEASMYWDGTAVSGYGDGSTRYYNADTAAYFYNGRAMFTQNQMYCNHAVAIIGWDDDYPAERFNALCRPSSNGAWLVRNSWGGDWGDDGCFWISYEDTNFPLDVCLIDGAVPFDRSVRVYETDYKTDISKWHPYNASSQTYGRAFLVDSAGEKLQSVKVMVPDALSTVEIDALPNLTEESLKSYRFSPKASLSAVYPGWYTIDFPSLISLGEAKSAFGIFVRIRSTGGGGAAIGCDTYNSLPKNSTAYYFNTSGQIAQTSCNLSAKAVTTTGSAEDFVADAMDALTWDLIRGENADRDDVRFDLALPSSLRGASVSWTSEPAGIVAADGTLTPPDRDTRVTLRAVVSRGGVSDSVSFLLTVMGVSSGDRDTVEAAAAALTWEVIQGDNASRTEVVSDLSLPETFQGASVVWTSSNEEVVTAAGRVFRPDAGSGDETVTLRASLRYGSAAADKTFSLTVLQRQEDDARLVYEEALYDWYGAWENVRGKNPSGYFGWENIRTDLVVPAPKYVEAITLEPQQNGNPWECVAADGTVTRPAFGQPDSVGDLAVWFWLDAAADEPDEGFLYQGYQVLAYRGEIRIDRQPEDADVSAGQISGFLRVDASQGAGDDGAIGGLSYQWYLAAPDGGTPVEGADSPVFSIPADLEEGSYSCYCEISAPDAAPILTRRAVVTVVAASERRNASVFFDSAGGSAVPSQTVEIGACVREPESPVRDGWIFQGWTLDGRPYDFSEPVAGDITLEAAWEPSGGFQPDDSEIQWASMYRYGGGGMEVYASVSSTSAASVWCLLYDGGGRMTGSGSLPFDGGGLYDFSFEDSDSETACIVLLDSALRPVCGPCQASNGWFDDDWWDDDWDDDWWDSDWDDDWWDDDWDDDWWDSDWDDDWWDDDWDDDWWDSDWDDDWWDDDWDDDWWDNDWGGSWRNSRSLSKENASYPFYTQNDG